ncbi:immunoglobulin superfamily member 5 isoform X2 [Triplophysa rosa]|uniref:immunoglobulin superfamily member 5 isoform X2 n=1 Tax=Triplophysa rosa TaxID=992332 RepID=UPI002545F284|nr:immunoglobulin superfamily member 5 isoform X2 [Triplophysa rosa]
MPGSLLRSEDNQISIAFIVTFFSHHFAFTSRFYFKTNHRGNMAVFRLALILLIIGGAAAQVQLEPQNVAVLRGSKAQFNCSTTRVQPIMTWSHNGILVVSIQPGSLTSSNPRFSATNYATPGSKWELNINNTERSDAGQVTCQFLGEEAQTTGLSVQERGSVAIIGGNQTVMQGAQTEYQCQASGWSPEPNVSWSVNGVVEKYCTNSSVAQGNVFNTTCTLTVTATRNSSVQCLAKVPAMSSPDSSTVFLTVGPKPRDQTILIAVTVAFSAAALLFLIIFGIIFFCKRRKKESYQEEVRRARLQSQHMTTVTSDARGRDTQRYVTDGRYGGDYNGGVWHTNYSPKQQSSYPRDDFFDDGYRNHRHMTMV